MEKASSLFENLYKCIRQTALSDPYKAADETYYKILVPEKNSKGKGFRKEYLWVVVGINTKMIYLLYNDGSQSELEKSKSIYEYGSYVYYETGSPVFGGGIASCLFPGKSRMSHVLFLLLVLAETAVAHATIPDGWWFLLPGVVSVLLRLSFKGGTESGKGGKALLSLHATDGTIIRYYYWFSNFLVYGGAGSGKTKSIGKPLMEQYIRSGFAGFIYDFKDFDYTRTAYNLIRKHGYPHEFYYVNFTDMNRTYRFNPLDRRNIKDRTMLMQLMEDVLGALMPPTSKQDEWYTGALGILNGVAYRLWDEFPECCTLPHIVTS